MTTVPTLHWYAIKAFWRRTSAIIESLEDKGIEYYSQSIMPSYLFMHTDRQTIKHMQGNCYGKYYVYADRKSREPSVVPDKEIEVFRIVTSSGTTGLEFLDDNPEKYQKGDKVRVTDGPFKGAEGYIIRIKKDRRLVVTISGIAAIATSYIPPELLEKI